MDKTKIREYISTYVERLKDLKPEKVILYGSFLTDKFSEESDIDLIVVADSFKDIDDFKRTDILYRRTVHLPLDFHIYGFTPDELKNISPLTSLHEAIKTGTVIA